MKAQCCLRGRRVGCVWQRTSWASNGLELPPKDATHIYEHATIFRNAGTAANYVGCLEVVLQHQGFEHGLGWLGMVWDGLGWFGTQAVL